MLGIRPYSEIPTDYICLTIEQIQIKQILRWAGRPGQCMVSKQTDGKYHDKY